MASATNNASEKTGVDSDKSPVPGRRILLWGRGGKSTLARALSEKLALPRLEMDAVAWLPDWQMRDTDEMMAIVDRFIADNRDGWVIDGQYGITLERALQGADTVIWLDLPFWTVYRRILRRSLRRVRDRQPVCGENFETWRRLLTSRESLPCFYIRHLLIGGNWKKQIAAREALLEDSGAHVNLTRLHSARDLDDFYAANDLVRAAG